MKTPILALSSLLLFSALSISGCDKGAKGSATPGDAQASSVQALPGNQNLTSIVAVIPVKDHAAAVAWYSKWIGRKADLTPVEGVAEWNLAGGGWLQVALDPEHAGGSSFVLGVRDLAAQVTTCTKAGVSMGEIQDHGFVKLAEGTDPDGNKIIFVEDPAPQ